MIFKLLDFIAPYHCIFCGKVGSSLCQKCNNNITKLKYNNCINCNKIIINNKCCSCEFKNKQIILYNYEDDIKKILREFKYNLKRDLAQYIATDISKNIKVNKYHKYIIIPIPTSSTHKNVRGFDHTKCIAKELTKTTNIKTETLLQRRDNRQQVGKSAHIRQKQAKNAFYCPTRLSDKFNYILIDDVSTTGSTLIQAANVMRRSGAKHITCLAYAR